MNKCFQQIGAGVSPFLGGGGLFVVVLLFFFGFFLVALFVPGAVSAGCQESQCLRLDRTQKTLEEVQKSCPRSSTWLTNAILGRLPSVRSLVASRGKPKYG